MCLYHVMKNVYKNLAFIQDHDDNLTTNVYENFPSRSWSWFNEERIWKPFLQDHDHDLIKNI